MLYQDAAKCSFHLLDTYDLLLFFVHETSWEVKQNLWVTNWSNGLRCLTSCEAIGAVSGSNLQSVHFVYSGWLWSKIYENIVFQSFRKLLFVVTLFYHKEREFSLFTLYSFISIIISLRQFPRELLMRLPSNQHRWLKNVLKRGRNFDNSSPPSNHTIDQH